MKNTSILIFSLMLFSATVFSQEWTAIPYEDVSDESLRITSLYEDTEGNIWGGNDFSGRVIRWDGTTWITYNSSETGLDYEVPRVGPMLQDSDGKMWFCSGDGVATWENDTWVNYQTDNSSIPVNSATGVIEEDGLLWFTMRQNIVSFDGTIWTSTAIPDADWNTGGLASMGNGSFFIPMVNGDPVRRFDGTDFEIFSTSNSDINSNFQYHVAKVDDQTFWFGGPNGRANLYENGTWTPSDNIQGWSLGLSEYITEIAINGSKDDVWFSNGDGLFHLKDGVGIEYNASNSPMTSTTVHTVMIASDGKIWCTTDNEILTFDPAVTNSTRDLSSNISLTILANPVQETVNLTIERKDVPLSTNGSITIYNISGQALISQKVTGPVMSIKVSPLSAGKYILQYSDGKSNIACRFVKQ